MIELRKIGRILFLVILLLLSSCHTYHHEESSFHGVYTCFDNNRRPAISFNYLMELYENGTCSFVKSYDLCTIVWTGRWTKQGKRIIIAYANKPSTDISSALMSGGYMEGTDTILICGTNRLKLEGEKVLLRKRLSDDSYGHSRILQSLDLFPSRPKPFSSMPKQFFLLAQTVFPSAPKSFPFTPEAFFAPSAGSPSGCPH